MGNNNYIISLANEELLDAQRSFDEGNGEETPEEVSPNQGKLFE